jgi:hypothetical protein
MTIAGGSVRSQTLEERSQRNSIGSVDILSADYFAKAGVFHNHEYLLLDSAKGERNTV